MGKRPSFNINLIIMIIKSADACEIRRENIWRTRVLARVTKLIIYHKKVRRNPHIFVFGFGKPGNVTESFLQQASSEILRANCP